jgi:dTDP-4-dehydrorhamnose reductase
MTKKRVVVLGAQGMAGHIMAEYLDGLDDYQVLGIARQSGAYVHKQLDVADFSALKEFLTQENPDLVINCIGILVASSKQDIANAILINSYLPHFLAETGAALQFKLIHISTDCVFSGKTGQYTEEACRDGDDNYARTKALGEVVNERDLTVRTSIIGPELKQDGTGLLGWFLKQTNPVQGYSRAFWSGVTTLQLAKDVDLLIRQGICGLYQLCPVEKISKYDLLKLIAKTWERNIDILPQDSYQVDKSLICTRTDFEHVRPRYEPMLQDLKQWMSDHHDYYTHYEAKGE